MKKLIDLHVGLQLLPSDEIVCIAFNGHVVEAEQAVECDAIGLLQFLLVHSLH